ncbi:hypothetical protein [Streptomyces sp. NPDC002738]
MEMRDKLDWRPGSKMHNSPLHREFDKNKAGANRAIACPTSGQYALDLHPLATPGQNKVNGQVQCDEYAFAASKESGGSQAGVTNDSQCLQAYTRKGADGKWRLYDDLRAQNTAPTYSERCARASMHGKPHTVPPDDSLVTGAVLDIAAQLLGTPDRHEARERLDPLVLRLRDADRALSTYLRRPGWISKQLRSANEDDWTGASRRSKPSTSSPASSPAEPRTTWPTSTWLWPPGGASRLSATSSTAHAKNSASPPEAPPHLGGAP